MLLIKQTEIYQRLLCANSIWNEVAWDGMPIMNLLGT